jgi:hypothetical protein
MTAYPSSGPDVNVMATSVTTPTDRVRWPSIFAGLFAALSALVVLAVLGVAVAGSAYDPGDNARNFGIGAGIWSAISALIAFFIGGFLAARTAAVRGHRNGVLNGSMVWVVAIPMILWMLVGGLNSLFRTTADSISAGAQAATARENMARNDANRDAADRAGDRSADRTADRGDARTEDRARTASMDLQATTQRITQQAGDPKKQEEVADKTAKSAWGTLVSLLLGLAAAAAGGYFGSRDRLFGDRDLDNDRDRDRGDRYRDDVRNRPSASGPTIVTPSGPSSDRP